MKLRITLFLFVFSLAVSCDRNAIEIINSCPEEAARQLALDRLSPQLGSGQIDNRLTIWASGDYSIEDWRPQLDQEQANLDRLRKWADSLQDECAREAYLHWIDYYQHQELDSAWHELRTQDERKEMEACDARIKREEENMEKYADRVDGRMPEPPTN